MAEILEAAWALSREHGLAGLSLRDIAHRIGMRPPSLYWYFDSKHAIYDAMFAQGNRQLLERLEAQAWPAEPVACLRLGAQVFVEFSSEDVERYQLMFQRTIPGFEPSPASYALALEVMALMAERFGAMGVDDPAALDIWTALVAGLAAQQVANQPGGDRWLRLVDQVAEMYANHVLPPPRSRRRR